MKTIRAFELDTGFEFSITNALTKATENISTYQQLWLEDSNSQSTNTSPKAVARGGYTNHALKVSTDLPVTESVRRVSPRTKRQKVDAAAISVEIDSDSSDEPLFTANVNVSSALQPESVNKQGTCQTGPVDQSQAERLIDGNNSKLASKTVLEQLFSSEIDENNVSDQELVELDSDSCANESETAEKQESKGPSERSFCSPEVHSPPGVSNKVDSQNLAGHNGEMVAATVTQICAENQCFIDSGEEFLDKLALKRGKGGEYIPEDLKTNDHTSPAKGFLRGEEKPSDPPASAKRKGQRSIERVSEWLSNIDAEEVASLGVKFNPSRQRRESDAEGGESTTTDENSGLGCSEAIARGVLPSPLEDRNPSKAAGANAEDQIFGKTYKRGRRESPRISRLKSDGKGHGDDPSPRGESNFHGVDCNKRQKGKKRKSGCLLGPEDFIKKNGSDQDKEHRGDHEEHATARSVHSEMDKATNGHSNNQDFVVAPLGGEAARNVLAEDDDRSGEEQCRGRPDPEPCVSLAKSKRKLNRNSGKRKVKKTPGKQPRKGTKRLQLVGQNEMERIQLAQADPGRSPSDANEIKIDSFPSSEEPARKEQEVRSTRRSGRLKLLDQELLLHGNRRSGKSGSCLKTARIPEPSEESADVRRPDLVIMETGSSQLQEVLVPKLPDNINRDNPPPCGLCEFPPVQQLNPTSPVKSLEVARQGCDLPCGVEHLLGSDCSSGTQASLLLLAPQPVHGDLCDELRVQPECAKDRKLSAGGVSGLSAVPPGDELAEATEKMTVASETEVAPETEDSEVDTQALLKTFRSTKRKSFVLQPVDNRAPSAAKPVPTSGEPAADLKETSERLAVRLERARDFNESRNEDETGSQNEQEDALVTSKAKAKLPVVELNIMSQQCRRTEGEFLDFVPPTFGSPVMPPFPQGGQQRATPPSGSPGAATRSSTRSSRRRGSSDGVVAGVTERETLRSDRSSQRNSLVPATPTSEHGQSVQQANPGFPCGVEEITVGTELACSSNPESTLLFSAKSQAVTGEGTRLKSGSKADEMSEPGGFCNRGEPSHSQRNFRAKVGDGDSTEDELADQAEVTKVASQLKERRSPLASPMGSSTPEGLVEERVNQGGLEKEGGEVQSESQVRRVEELLHCEDEEMAEPSERGLEDSGGPALVVGRRKRPVKLSSSSSSGSELSDEELPCFQMFGFKKSGSNVTSATQSPLSTALVPSKDTLGKIFSPPPKSDAGIKNTCSQVNAALEEFRENLLRNRCLSPSESSEESPDLFSSDSDCCSTPSGSQAEQGASNKPAREPISSGSKTKRDGKRRSSQVAKIEKTLQRREASDHQQSREPGEAVPEHSGGGQAACYDSEASHTGDSLSSDSELLTTQQRDAIQINLKKLKEEMAVLEAALEQDTEQQASQNTAHSLSRSPQDTSPVLSEDEQSAVASVTRAGAGQALSEAATNLISESKYVAETIPTEPESQQDTSLIFRDREQNECPESPEYAVSPSLTERQMNRMPLTNWTVAGALGRSQSERNSQGEDVGIPHTPPQQESRASAVTAGQEELGGVAKLQRSNGKGKDCGSEQTEAVGSLLAASSRCQPAPGTAASACTSQVADGVGRPEASSEGLEQSRSLLTSSPIFNKSADSATSKSPAMTTQRKMSFVASGLDKHEILLVQRFAEKTGGAITSQFLPSTTHVVMRTGTSLVCERTLKYFLGIAGRRWVISYQWILECFKEGRIIEESEFEVRGDVINGRNHQGPRKARQTSNGQLLLTDYEVCCWGSFTGMSKDQLEWMVDLCGASIAKEPYLFTYNPGRVSVVVVQPDANPASTDYRGMERRFSAAVVTREWVLDSVACYCCHPLEAYLLGSPR
ncbi:breast cancer type 1 susceptibility protein homolog isoform X2 [Callorhinchus milii]|uniref:breast cancer type 1 susceptibility protein homolog isoform X2 n=1 Tax=Callorhinchus milii TaxID=7868 RepID=UPI001C3FD551|nr:breast cancer type 1 susceptibility protein homolog isoform X2 [Callorhinchus milii]